MNQLQSQRLAYGEELVALGRDIPRVIALEANLGKSTMSCLFQQAFPERYFEMGIAEQKHAFHCGRACRLRKNSVLQYVCRIYLGQSL